MPKKILTIEVQLATEAAHNEPYTSHASLLDWDIIVFRPQIPEAWTAYGDNYNGKPCLNDPASFALKEASEHWRREIKQAVETGKTVVVLLPPLEEVYVATGRKEISGTGRNARTTRIVDLHSNYDALPIAGVVTNSSGSAMKLVARIANSIAPYWKEFGDDSEYKVILPVDLKNVCILTKHGDRPVGALIRSQGSVGSLVLLPDINFLRKEFFQIREGKSYWTKEAKTFASRWIGALVALDAGLHAGEEVSPEPVWVSNPKFALLKELTLQQQLLESEQDVEEAQKRKEAVQEDLKAARRPRALLYEKGKQLETAIVEALMVLGFKAAPFRDETSEFDVIFESPEGRLLGEAEGKDGKAINVDKLRQLAMNIHEDLQREEVSAPAKGVLFGNGFRLTAPADRGIQFTEKCITAAQSSSTALITTSSLYAVVQYLSENADDRFAKRCRETMLSNVGFVELPTPPIPPI